MSFGKLRDLFLFEPSKTTWKKILRIFERWSDETSLEQGLLYAEEHLRHWDPYLRHYTLLQQESLPFFWRLIRSCSMEVGGEELPPFLSSRESEKLVFLDLSNSPKLRSLEGLFASRNLRELHLDSCPSLQSLEGCQKFPNLRKIQARFCLELNNIDAITGLNKLISFDVSAAEKIKDFSAIADLSCLEDLNLSCCTMEDLGFLRKLQKLKKLDLWDCRELLNMKGLVFLSSLSFLQIVRVSSLVMFPHLLEEQPFPHPQTHVLESREQVEEYQKELQSFYQIDVLLTL